MGFQSLNYVLDLMKSQLISPEQLQFQFLLSCWSQVVEEGIVKYTQPISIYRGVLKVATPSSALAQDLTFKRRQILAKLNSRLQAPLHDLHFSTAGWRNFSDPDYASVPSEIAQTWQAHPSRLLAGSPGNQTPSLEDSLDAPAAFRQWAEKIQWRSQSLPLCPHCQSPTPIGELQRWLVCAPCASNHK